MTKVLFVCIASSGRSVMAERIFRQLAGDRHQARSAGSDPGTGRPQPQVVQAPKEIGIDASDHVPRALDSEALSWADIAVSTCSEEVCLVTPGVRRISWELPDPKNLPLEQVRPIRDEIAHRVDHILSPSPVAMTALTALAQADTVLVWDPDDQTLIAAYLRGTMPWTERLDEPTGQASAVASASRRPSRSPCSLQRLQSSPRSRLSQSWPSARPAKSRLWVARSA